MSNNEIVKLILNKCIIDSRKLNIKEKLSIINFISGLLGYSTFYKNLPFKSKLASQAKSSLVTNYNKYSNEQYPIKQGDIKRHIECFNDHIYLTIHDINILRKFLKMDNNKESIEYLLDNIDIKDKINYKEKYI